ncbi:MAG: pyridoxamine 5'-phosphate oxidase family protein [Caldisphaera sp.]
MDFLNKNFLCHVGFIYDGVPYVIPMLYSNDDNYIYLHGSPESRIVNVLKVNGIVSISVTKVNGIVLAEMVKDNSVNYVSVVIFGKSEEVKNNSDKLKAFKNLMDRMVPERWENSILPSDNDLNNVSIIKISIDKFSIKKREGGPKLNHKSSTNKNNIWSGEITIKCRYEKPIDNENIPNYIAKLIGKQL